LVPFGAIRRHSPAVSADVGQSVAHISPSLVVSHREKVAQIWRWRFGARFLAARSWHALFGSAFGKSTRLFPSFPLHYEEIIYTAAALS
jgi:hypothetical protein